LIDGSIRTQVGVTARRDYAFARIESQYLRRVGRRHLGKSLQGHPALHHAFRVDDSHPRLGAEIAAGYVIDLLAAIFPSLTPTFHLPVP
jgi:hypothetical protein